MGVLGVERSKDGYLGGGSGVGVAVSSRWVYGLEVVGSDFTLTFFV